MIVHLPHNYIDAFFYYIPSMQVTGVPTKTTNKQLIWGKWVQCVDD